MVSCQNELGDIKMSEMFFKFLMYFVVWIFAFFVYEFNPSTLLFLAVAWILVSPFWHKACYNIGYHDAIVEEMKDNKIIDKN